MKNTSRVARHWPEVAARPRLEVVVPAGRIDWAAVHHRLELTAQALDRVLTGSPEETRRILRTRAAALARETNPASQTQESLDIVKFLLAGERYGVESRFVTEVCPLKEFTPLPCTPPFVLGAVNVRGQILTVIDIKKFFDLPEKGLTELNKIIFLRVGRRALGILADAIVGVCPVPLDGVQTSLPTLKGIREEYLRGVTEESLAILDVEKLFSTKNIIVHQEP